MPKEEQIHQHPHIISMRYFSLLVLYLYLLLILFGSCSKKSFRDKNINQWEQAEWTIVTSAFHGNPFDVIATAVFRHEETGQVVRTSIFYDEVNQWKFRFTNGQTGRWKFLTESEKIEDLKEWSGNVLVEENDNSNAHGFIKNLNGQWGRQGTEEAFVPQYVMGKDLNYYYDFSSDQVDERRINDDIQEFIVEHGFTGFHLRLGKCWFDLEENGTFENPDPKSYRVLESMLTKVHALGGSCHLWMWGSDGPRDRFDGDGPRGVLGAHGNEKDLRNLRYLAARLGPIPGWTIGFGVDTENATASAKQLDNWKAYLDEHMGWDHFIGARVGYDEKGLWALRPPGARPAHDENFCSEIKDEHCSWLGGDYMGYTSYRPMYERYREAMEHRPHIPSFEEDRFRLRDSPKWTYKDYNQERTRRGLWNSAMAGGVANIWGNLLPEADHGGSQPYDVDTIDIKHQIKSNSLFFEKRFSRLLKVYDLKKGSNLRCLKSEDNLKIIFYQENTDEIGTIDLAIPVSLQVIAVDTRKAYKEISISPELNNGFHWDAPYTSDWAVAIGDFMAKE